tara:strand:+ start:411 stop:563 length:153 start_codon:yes stop_codon:yes gene_type:complete
MKKQNRDLQTTKHNEKIKGVIKPLSESETLDLLIYGEDVIDIQISDSETE